MRRMTVHILAVVLLAVSFARAETLTVIGFNVEAKQPSSPPNWDSTIDTVAAIYERNEAAGYEGPGCGQTAEWQSWPLRRGGLPPNTR